MLQANLANTSSCNVAHYPKWLPLRVSSWKCPSLHRSNVFTQQNGAVLLLRVRPAKKWPVTVVQCLPTFSFLFLPFLWLPASQEPRCLYISACLQAYSHICKQTFFTIINVQYSHRALGYIAFKMLIQSNVNDRLSDDVVPLRQESLLSTHLAMSLVSYFWKWQNICCINSCRSAFAAAKNDSVSLNGTIVFQHSSYHLEITIFLACNEWRKTTI